MTEVIKFISEKFIDDKYRERVARNSSWLGNSVEEQLLAQNKIRDTVVGIAGTGGIGGALAVRLVRMGVRKIKLADPDTFDYSNIHRQLGAESANIGRNKALVVAEEAYKLTRDVDIDVYKDGITPENAEQFIEGCDYVLDQMDFYEIKNRYALHRAFRKSERCRFMFKVPTVGHSVIIFKYTKDSMPIEEVYDLPENVDQHAPDTVLRLIERILPEISKYKDITEFNAHMLRGDMPIFAACPPLAEGALAEKLAHAIIGFDDLPEAVVLPEQPGYAIFDTLTWTAKTVTGKWW